MRDRSEYALSIDIKRNIVFVKFCKQNEVKTSVFDGKLTRKRCLTYSDVYCATMLVNEHDLLAM